MGILVGMLKPTAMKANNKVEYALNAITNYATANTKYKEPVLQAMKAALDKAYAGVEKISFEGAHFRRDIGQDLLSY